MAQELAGHNDETRCFGAQEVESGGWWSIAAIPSEYIRATEFSPPLPRGRPTNDNNLRMELTMKTLIVALTIVFATCSLEATEFHVSPKGLDLNNGSQSKPFKTISAAAKTAHAGDVIIVHEGLYRERVNPPRGGESDAKRIVYRAARGEKVVLKGSEVIKDWAKVQQGVWKVTLPNTFFSGFNPYEDVIGGEWHRNIGYPRHTGTVYLNGRWLDEAKVLDDILTPIGDRPLWKADVDQMSTTIWAQFNDVDPNKELVEINVRQSIFYPHQPGRNYITVRGFTMRHAATPWSGAMSEQIGLIGTHWSKGWIIENNVISHSMNTGITLGRYQIKDAPMPPATAPGFVKSVEMAIENGWAKERIGSHVVRNNHISHCEKNGIHGSLGGIFSTIEGNTICDIAMRGWIGGPDVAGLKLLASNDVIIRNNHFYRCGGTGGVWLDWMAQGTRFTGNLLHGNRNDLFVEVNHGPFLIDHNLFLSREAIRDWSQGAAYAHNLIVGNISSRQEKRETPYFRPHTVAGMKTANINHKDTRYYNNVFVGFNGLSSLGADAMNLQAAGNVYLGGATPSLKDRDSIVEADVGLAIKLEKKSDGWWLHLKLDRKWAAAKRKLVITQLLGKATIPAQPFENRDGSPLQLTTDFFGKAHHERNPFPGPFEWTEPSKGLIRVWRRATPEH